MNLNNVLTIAIFLLFLISCVIAPEETKIENTPKVTVKEEFKAPEPIEPKALLKSLLEKASQTKEVFVSYDSEEMLSDDAKATFNSTLFIKGNDFRRDALIESYLFEDNSWNLADNQVLMETFAGETYTKCIQSGNEEANCVETNMTKEEKKEYLDLLKDKDMIDALDKYTISLLPSQTIEGDLLACFKVMTPERLESEECYSKKTGFLTTYKTAAETRSLKTLEFTVPEDAFN